ncbi:hypothetical protein F4776DRAFT_157340 [Hypoxylon sp. NC0597]|nr:hypothetical protein F4776DRAFT_157340 [Hypoxylon sp. NC0597]
MGCIGASSGFGIPHSPLTGNMVYVGLLMLLINISKSSQLFFSALTAELRVCVYTQWVILCVMFYDIVFSRWISC